MNLEAAHLQQQITSLLLDYPDLADDEVLRADMIEGSTELVDFLRRLERDRQETSAHATALDENIKSLKLRKYRMERREEAMRALALKLLFVADQNKLTLPEATYSVRTIPPSVLITDEDALPDCACTFVRKPNKTVIKEMLEVAPVPGATMSNGGKTLSIRTK